MKRPRQFAICALAFVVSATPALVAQQNSGRLGREQNEILRKAQRLTELMQRLLTRYERDGETEKVKLLKAGLEHVTASGILDAASRIGNSLEDGALDDALREQAKVVDQLERLLDILLDRQSVDNLDEEIEQASKMIDTVAELARRQAELRDDAQNARADTASPAERELTESLRTLANEQRAEATANEREAGTRTPLLESALARLKSLLTAQKRLETGASRQLDDRPDPGRATSFELGSIEQDLRDVMAQRSAQREAQRLAETADTLRAAADNGDADESGLRNVYDRTRARLEDRLARRAFDEEAAAKLQAALDALKQAAPGAMAGDAAARDELSQAAAEVEKAAREAQERAAAAADAAQTELSARAEQAARKIEREAAGEGKKPSATGSSNALDRAVKAMKQAVENSQKSEAGEAMSETSKALRQLAESRQALENESPSPATRAKNMAAAADQVARSLENQRDPAPTDREAAQALKDAREALRAVGEDLEKDESGAEDAAPKTVDEQLDTSRKGLERATDALERALDASTAGKEAAMEAARQRQDQLNQRIDAAKADVQRAAESGDITPEQAKAAEDAIDAASKNAQNASEKLGQQQQSAGAQAQREAAKQLDRAQEGLENNRPVSESEREAMKEVADQQEELEDDIIQLAKLAEERKNREAEKALERAAEASKRASKALNDGETQSADEQQAEAQKELEKAKDALEEERDRYMDLRQEELLFKIGEELAQFLDAQKPLTRETAELAAQLQEQSRLSRPARRKLNQIGERELELVARTEFIYKALVDEGVQVFSHALQANANDLREIAGRLAGRSPDPSDYTHMLQIDVEERAQKLIDALKRERLEREQQQQQQQGQEGNQFGNRQQRLVSLVAELKMLKQMEEDLRVRSTQVERLLQVAGADGVTEFDLAMAERLAHQHSALTGLFQNLKKMIEEALQPPEEPDDPFGEPKKGEGK